MKQLWSKQIEKNPMGYQAGEKIRLRVEHKANTFGQMLNENQFRFGVVFRNSILILIMAGFLTYFLYIILTAFELI